MKTKPALQRLCLLLPSYFLLLPFVAAAATNDLTSALQRGLFEEEANRNLEAATAAYQSLVTQFDKDRQIAATAVFRLGEVYRKQGKTNEAVLQYERIVKEFPDQQTLATLSRQNLIGLGAGASARPAVSDLATTPTLSPAARAEQRRLLDEEIKLVEQNLDRLRRMGDRVSQGDLVAPQRELFDLKRQLVALSDEPPIAVSPGVRAEQRRLLEEEIKLVEQKVSEQQKLMQSGLISPSDLVSTQRDLLELKRRLVALSDEALMSPAAAEEQARLLAAQISGIERLADNPVEQARAVIALFPDEDLKKRVFELPNSPPNAPEVVAGFLQDIKRRVDFILNTQKARLKVLGTMGGSTAVGAAGSHPSTLDGLQSQYALLKAQLEQARKETNNEVVARLFDDEDLKQRNENVRTLARSLEAGRSSQSQDWVASYERGIKNSEQAVAEARTRLFNYQELRLRILESAIQQAKAATAPKLTDLSVPPPTDDEDQEIRRIQAMIQNSPDLINAPVATSAYMTPLATAALQGQLRVARFLLDNGADHRLSGDPDANKMHKTPLQHAAESGHKAMVELLLIRGADPNAVNEGRSTPVGGNRVGSSPLGAALARRFRAVVETLLERGADPNLPSAADLPLTIAARQSDKALVELLLSKGARINAVDGNGRTALLWMASGSNLDTNGLETVSLLHDRGADPNLADQSGRTPLHHSVARGSTNLLALLVQRGADVSARDKQGRTLLHEAVDSNRSEIVAAVLALKVDPNLPNKSGITPLDDAKRARPAGRRSQPVVTEEQSAIAAMLRQHGALDELPQWDRIMVRRVSVSFLTPVLWKGTNDWNRFNLIELIAAHYNLVSAWPIWSVNYQWTYGFGQPSSSRQYGDKSYKTRLTSTETSVGIPFPDLSRIVIRRPTADGRKWETIPVNLTEILASGECDKAPWLEWGDVVELPESDHLVDEVWSSFGSEIMGQLKKCLKRDILLLIKGETNSLTLEPKVTADQTRKLVLTWTANQPYSLVPVLTTSGLLRASSDVSKVKVTRVDPGGAKKEWVLDCSNPDNAPDLWLRDGDVIEVPEKP